MKRGLFYATDFALNRAADVSTGVFLLPRRREKRFHNIVIKRVKIYKIRHKFLYFFHLRYFDQPNEKNGILINRTRKKTAN